MDLGANCHHPGLKIFTLVKGTSSETAFLADQGAFTVRSKDFGPNPMLVEVSGSHWIAPIQS